MYNNYLYHHGIKGQKWGIRRYQNADGSLTAEGKAKKKEKRKSASEVCSKGRKAASAAMSKIRTIALKVFIADTVDSMMFGGAGKKSYQIYRKSSSYSST